MKEPLFILYDYRFDNDWRRWRRDLDPVGEVAPMVAKMLRIDLVAPGQALVARHLATSSNFQARYYRRLVSENLYETNMFLTCTKVMSAIRDYMQCYFWTFVILTLCVIATRRHVLGYARAKGNFLWIALVPLLFAALGLGSRQISYLEYSHTWPMVIVVSKYYHVIQRLLENSLKCYRDNSRYYTAMKALRTLDQDLEALRRESTYRKKMLATYMEFKRRLDYQVAYLELVQIHRAEHLVDWLLGRLEGKCGAEMDKQMVEYGIEALGTLPDNAFNH